MGEHFSGVKTLIASGNVLFETEAGKGLKDRIETALEGDFHDLMEIGYPDMRETAILEHMQEAGQYTGNIVPVIVLKVVRAIHRVELIALKGCQLARITHDVRRTRRVDVEQQVLEARIARRQRDELVVAPDIQYFLHLRALTMPGLPEIPGSTCVSSQSRSSPCLPGDGA